MDYVFVVISLLGGLAMFLYGMRLMGNNLKESSSGTLKLAMEKVTDNYFKAFLLGLLITAVIQSSTATIVITSGLVAAGVISLDQSLGIIVGANVGTTVTGQIIRLLDVNADSSSLLRFFQPSTLAPIALIFGVVLIMGFKFKRSDSIGNIAIGFGILFSGLLNMTNAVSGLTESGILDKIFANLGANPFLGYLSGAGVAFVLQSSSATIGMLQAFSLAGDLPFSTIYVVLVGVYLGDCVTTAIVCAIGAKADAKRVGIVNILFNLGKTILVIVVVTILHKVGLLDNIWNMPLRSGGIANTNTVFNLGCAIVLLPFVFVFKKLANIIVKDEPAPKNKYQDKIDALNPIFFATPALAFRSVYDVLTTMFTLATTNIAKALALLDEYDEGVFDSVQEEEENIDFMTDCVDNYLVKISPHISEELHTRILTQYHKVVSEFEHLGDYASHIADTAKALNDENVSFSDEAREELMLVKELLWDILQYTRQAFVNRDEKAAAHIEPMEEVMNDLVTTLHDNHLVRLRDGVCTVRGGILFNDVLTNVGRISDTCSNVGVATILRVNPSKTNMAHSYVSAIHSGVDTQFNDEYKKTYEEFFGRLGNISNDTHAL